MLLNLLNACVIEGKALPENLATFLGILCPLSVTSAFMASLWPQCFSTKGDLGKESALVYCHEVFWLQNVSVHSSAVLTLTSSVTSSLLAGRGSRSFSLRPHGDR